MATIKGGDKLERRLLDMARRVSKPGTLRVGFLENATYPSGKNVAMIAAIQNWGAPGAGIPPRPFFSNMVRDKKKYWGDAVALNLRAQNYDATRALDLVGLGIEGQLRQSIIDTNSPPLAASTLRKRGYKGAPYNPKDPKTFRAKPLVDTGHMLGSVDHEVKT